MALPIQAVIHELSEEVMNFNQLTSFYDVPRKFFNHGMIGRMSLKNYHRYVLSYKFYRMK